jgi:hypothetical protein
VGNLRSATLLNRKLQSAGNKMIVGFPLAKLRLERTICYKFDIAASCFKLGWLGSAHFVEEPGFPRVRLKKYAFFTQRQNQRELVFGYFFIWNRRPHFL